MNWTPWAPWELESGAVAEDADTAQAIAVLEAAQQQAARFEEAVEAVPVSQAVDAMSVQ